MKCLLGINIGSGQAAVAFIIKYIVIKGFWPEASCSTTSCSAVLGLVDNLFPNQWNIRSSTRAWPSKAARTHHSDFNREVEEQKR